MNAPTVDNLARDLLETAPGLEVVTDHVELPPDCRLPTQPIPARSSPTVVDGTIHLWEQGRGESEINAGGTVKVAVHTVRTGPDGARLVVFRVHEVGKPDRTLVAVDDRD